MWSLSELPYWQAMAIVLVFAFLCGCALPLLANFIVDRFL
jgi:membrane glycosyltransferase